MAQAASTIDIAIAKSCHDKKRRRVCEPVLVTFPSLYGVRYGTVIQCVVVCSLVVPFPCREKEISPRSRRRILGEILKTQVRSEPIRGLLRGAGANDAQEADVRGVVEVEGA